MSAYIVHDSHIDAILTWASDKGCATPVHFEKNLTISQVRGNESAIGQILINENTKSVNHRYKDDSKADRYTFKRFPIELTPVEMIKAIECLDYQSCEHDGWAGSFACNVLKWIGNAARDALPGYDAAPWGIDPVHACKLVNAKVKAA